MAAQQGTEEYAANLALGHALQPEIATMNDATTRARKVRQHFAQVRDALLREKDWNFATMRCTPALDPAAGTGRFARRYVLPSDCLKVRFVRHLADDQWAVEAAIATVGGVPVDSGIIAMNADAPTVEYTRRVETVRLWDALFLEVFALRLGAVLARELGKSATREAQLLQDADRRLGVASSVDSKETARRAERPETRLEAARRGYRRGTWGGRLQGGP